LKNTSDRFWTVVQGGVLIWCGAVIYSSRVTEARVVIDWGPFHQQIGFGLGVVGVISIVNVLHSLFSEQ